VGARVRVSCKLNVLLHSAFCDGGPLRWRTGIPHVRPLSTNLIGPPVTELWHILAVYIICPCALNYDLFSPKLGLVQNIHTYFAFLTYSAINFIYCGPVAMQPALPWQQFYAPLIGGVVLMLSPKYELDRSIHYIAILNWIRYVTLRPWPLTSWPWVPLGWSTPVLSLRWMWLTVPELGRLQVSLTASLKSQFLRFFGE